MINEVINLKEGKVLKDNEAKDEIIKFFKFIQKQNLILKDFYVNKYNYIQQSDEYSYELHDIELNKDNISIDDININIKIPIYVANEFIIINENTNIWYRYIKDKNDVVLSYGIDNENEKYKITYIFSW